MTRKTLTSKPTNNETFFSDEATLVKMTLKTLMSNFGYFSNQGKVPYHHRIEYFHTTTPSIQDRYHHGHSGYKGKGGGGGGSGAALSALTLLAFLFLMNVMQQSLQENGNTTMMGTTAVLLRDNEEPISLISTEEKDTEKRDSLIRLDSTYGSVPKSILLKDSKQQQKT